MSASGVSLLHPWNKAKAAPFTRDRGRLPHALLFAGPKGLGKNAFGAKLQSLVIGGVFGALGGMVIAIDASFTNA